MSAIVLDTNSDRRFLIVGLGMTGLACARYLLTLGAQVAIADSRENPPGLDVLQQEFPDVAVFLGAFDVNLFCRADMLVVSPGVALNTPEIAEAMRQGIPAIGDIELFLHAAKAPVVAITGSNGKSTVTTMFAEIAKTAGIRVAAGGNLGTPALDLLADDVELYVLELSSFQLETTYSLQASVATVLNIVPDHMDRYDSLEDYAAAKAKILYKATVGVYNADDARVMAMQGSEDALFFTAGESNDDKSFGICHIDGQDWLCRGRKPVLAASELKIPGVHNYTNALAAMAMAFALQIDEASICQAMRDYRGLPHRTEYVTTINEVKWFNDSKGTNVGACVAALNGLALGDGSKTVLIAGGDCKDANFAELSDVLAKHARAVILIGRDAGDIAKIIPESVPSMRAADMGHAVQLAADSAVARDRVLLSPACASFDMYKNYMQRGEVFMEAVRRLAE